MTAIAKVGVVERRQPHPNRDIDALIDDVDSSIGRLECDPKLRGTRRDTGARISATPPLKQAGRAAEPKPALAVRTTFG